jgi:hypothetical protein
MNNIKQAFAQICTNAKPAQAVYVSLYRSTQYYGGPEEGGWYSHHNEVVAYQLVATEDQAEELQEQIQQLAKKLTEQSKRDFNEGCLRQMEFLEQRGLDADFLPEPDGEERYFVVIENVVGSRNQHGPTHYE